MTLEIYVTRPCSLEPCTAPKQYWRSIKLDQPFDLWSSVGQSGARSRTVHTEWMNGALLRKHIFFYLKCLAERSYVRIKLFHSKFIPMRLMLFTKESTKSTRSEKKMFMQMLWNFQRIFTRARAVKWATLMFIWPLFQESMAVDSE